MTTDRASVPFAVDVSRRRVAAGEVRTVAGTGNGTPPPGPAAAGEVGALRPLRSARQSRPWPLPEGQCRARETQEHEPDGESCRAAFESAADCVQQPAEGDARAGSYEQEPDGGA